MVISESCKTVLSISITTGAPLDTESVEKLRVVAFNRALSEEIRVAALQQLVVLLSDASLHGCFANLHGPLLELLSGEGCP